MRLIEDFKHEYKGFIGAPNGICRIRIFANEDNSKYVGVCSAIPENYTTSTTNVIEEIYIDVKSNFFEKSLTKPNQTPNERFNTILNLARDIDNRNLFSLIVQGLKILWSYKNKYETSNPSHPPMLWVDHWPKTIGLRPWENEFSFGQFSDDFVPNWIHVTEKKFVEFTGIDIRLINELELVDG